MTQETQPESKWVEAHGLRLHYADYGNSTAQPMVLLHGLQDCARLWDIFARSMSSQYHVMAVDHRGHGDSPWAETYHLEDYLEELNELLATLVLRNVVLIGHSAGGKNSFIHTSRHPDRIARLVILEMDPDAVNPGSAQMFTRYRSESDEYPDMPAVVERIRSRQPRAADEVNRHNAQHMTKPLPTGGLIWKRDRDLVTKYERPDAWEYLPRISVPTLIVRGEDSPLLTAPVAQKMNEQIPGSKLAILPGGGHWVHLENPPAFEAAIRDFLDA